MTTIVATLTEVAWDGQQTFGSERAVDPTPKVVVGCGKIIAYTGASSMQAPIVRWIHAGAKPEKVPKSPDAEDGGWDILVITKVGSIITAINYDNNNPYGVPVELPLALGSGRQYAMGVLNHYALKKGKVTAREAVEAAAVSDIYTGGEIKSLKIKEALGRKRK